VRSDLPALAFTILIYKSASRVATIPETERPETDVVVVGLGPVGAVLTLLLALRGIRVTTLERFPSVFPSPRAVHLDSEVMRVLGDVGVAETSLPTMRPVVGMDMLGVRADLIFQFRADDPPVDGKWAEGYMFEQPSLETTLRERLRDFPTATLQLGHEVTSIEPLSDALGGVVVRSQRAGEEHEVRGRLLVGCDGSHSMTRSALDSDLFDYGVEKRWLVVDVALKVSIKLPEVTVQYCEPARPCTYVPLPGNRRRFELLVLPGEDPESMTEPDVVRSLLSRWLEPADYFVDRATVYSFHGLVASRWRSGPLMIAGDAAHQMPPFLGQGMCAGVRDAANLAWKIDLVLSGAASSSLLDTYQTEREPRVRRIIETDLYLADLIQTMDEEKAAARDVAATKGGHPTEIRPRPYPIGLTLSPEGEVNGLPFPQGITSQGVRLDDLIGPNFALVGQVELTNECAAILDLIGTRRVSDPPDSVRQWLSDIDASAVLVRPDHNVLAAVNSPEDLMEALLPLAEHLTHGSSDSI